jgi:hypothetical protein
VVLNEEDREGEAFAVFVAHVPALLTLCGNGYFL